MSGTTEIASLLQHEARPESAEGREAPSGPASPRGWSAKAMQRYLEGPHQEVRDRVRAWLQEPEFRRSVVPLDEHRERTWRWCRTLAERGLPHLGMPCEVGGKGDLAGALAATGVVAQFDGSLFIKLGVQVGLFGGSLYHLGTRRHHEQYLKDVFDLKLPGCFAMTERDHGSNVRELRTRARYDQATGEFVIHTPDQGARKEWIGNAAVHGRMATVFAQLEVGGANHGVHAFLVPLRDEQGRTLPGIGIEDCGVKLGLNGVDNGKLWFDQVRVPRENLLDRYAQVTPAGHYMSTISDPSRRFFTMLGTLVLGRVSLATAAVSATRVGLTIAVEYGEQRRQFGPAGQAETRILDYQAHQQRLMPALATCYALDFACRHLVKRFLRRTPANSQEVETLAAGLKSLASWEAVRIVQTCRECCGGNGYLWENRFADLKADLDVFTTFEGDNTVLMQLVARGLMTSYRHQFNSLKLGRLMRHLAGQARLALGDLNPLVPRMTSEEHLRDPRFQLGAFKTRESLLLVSVSRRLKKRLDAGMNPHAATNECQDHLLTLARAFTERVVVEQFQQGVARAPAELAPALKSLCDLYALHRLYEDRAWFLEHGSFEPAKSKALRDLVLKLCAEVRQDAVRLVRAFGIPPALLGPAARGEAEAD